jgi:quercetin 2,3-dioxygenase
VRDAAGRATEVMLIAGRLDGTAAPAPPPRSWAARAAADVAIWSVKLAPHAEWTLPAASHDTRRTLYYFRGESLEIGGRGVGVSSAIMLRADAAAALRNGSAESELLLLQGKPIGEPIAQYGPFVMNDGAEIRQAFIDYQRTEFGGWPWPSDDHVHPRDAGRHARYIGGGVEVPEARE